MVSSEWRIGRSEEIMITAIATIRYSRRHRDRRSRMLSVDNINLYYGAAQALRSVSLKAEPGKVTCVLGRNGVGKTSLLRALVGQHPISAGAISFEGSD